MEVCGIRYAFVVRFSFSWNWIWLFSACFASMKSVLCWHRWVASVRLWPSYRTMEGVYCCLCSDLVKPRAHLCNVFLLLAASCSCASLGDVSFYKIHKKIPHIRDHMLSWLAIVQWIIKLMCECILAENSAFAGFVCFQWFNTEYEHVRGLS